MNWFLIAYLLTMVWLSTRQEKLPRGFSLRAAWNWFALIPVSHFVFAVIRAANFGDVADLALIEIWSDGIGWLLLGLSMLSLARIIDHGQGQEPATYAAIAKENKPPLPTGKGPATSTPATNPDPAAGL